MKKSIESADRTAALHNRPAGWPVAAFLLAAVAALSGCSSSSSPKPQVVSIAVTDAGGNVLTTPLTSLTVNTGVYLDVTLTNDTAHLGADWTVACGSALAPGTPLPPGQTVSTACGTFTPVHTLSAPVPSYVSDGAGYVTLYTAPAVPPQGGIVTLYAAATADPSRYASLAFPVLGLPISIGFAPQPPTSLPVSGTTQLKAVVSNDYSPKGVTWTVTCGSAACGSFSLAQTASGVATTYTAPGTAPAGGAVTVSATSVTDPTKSVSATITIAPVAVSVVPASLSVAVGATGLLNATVTNDVSNAGVDWGLSCGSAGACGSITLHTASGAASTYTAPSDVPSGGTVTVTATSTADKTAAATSVITVTPTATPTVSGIVRSGTLPVSGASLSLYAAGETGYGSAATLLNDTSRVSTDANGRFTVSSNVPCPSADSPLYLAARGGNAGSGMNPNLVLITALGPCDQIARDVGSVAVDEATTVAAAYALSAFMRDSGHTGVTGSNRAGLTNAFATANEIVNMATGEIRSTTRTGDGVVPAAELNTLANVLHRCVASAGGRAGDGTPCGDLFLRTRPSDAADTLQSAAFIARTARQTSLPGGGATKMFELANPDGPFQPSLKSAPEDWSLRIVFPSATAAYESTPSAERPALSPEFDVVTVDGSGNEWLANREGGVTEIVGAAAPRPKD